jgi:hypothetical protein
MLRKILLSRAAITAVLCLQIIPVIIFPLSSFTVNSQEWWLPVLLTILLILSIIQLLFRKSRASWPWILISFTQGFNIISRLLMLAPHTTINVEGVQRFNAGWVGLAVLSMLLSAFALWYCELPEVRSRIME